MIQIRPYRADDYNFIVSSWSKSAYEYSSGKMEKFSIYHDGIKDLFDRKMKDEEIQCYIAYTNNDEDFILGYAVFGTDYTLHYCFTKTAFRNVGICKALLNHFYKSKKVITVSHYTKFINYIKKNYEVEYNRFKFYGVS
jgi:hypothetical protein